MRNYIILVQILTLITLQGSVHTHMRWSG